MAMPRKKATFESDLNRLREIVENMEDSETALEQAIALYKEGITLAAKCNQTLTTLEEEIYTLQKDADGGFVVV